MNFGRVGFTEMIMLLFAVSFWCVPVVVAVWAIMTLARMRRLLEDIAARLDALDARQSSVR
jgi:hypothetical protein